jgi:hypothetical protein
MGTDLAKDVDRLNAQQIGGEVFGAMWKSMAAASRGVTVATAIGWAICAAWNVAIALGGAECMTFASAQ